MGNCYSADRIVKDHIHTDVTLTLRNHRRSTALGWPVMDYLGSLNQFTRSVNN